MKIIHYWKPISIALLIMYGSLTSSNSLNKVTLFHIQNMDKIIHLFLYFILSLSFLSSLTRNTGLKKKDIVLINLLLVISYGLLMEVFQYSLTTDRSPEVFDALANTLGCILASFLFPYIRNLFLIKYL